MSDRRAGSMHFAAVGVVTLEKTRTEVPAGAQVAT